MFGTLETVAKLKRHLLTGLCITEVNNGTFGNIGLFQQFICMGLVMKCHFKCDAQS